MTEQQAIQLGFELKKEFLHDGFKTRRYRLGVIELEFTYWSDGELNSVDVTIEEINCMDVDLSKLEKLVDVLKDYEG